MENAAADRTVRCLRCKKKLMEWISGRGAIQCGRCKEVNVVGQRMGVQGKASDRTA